MDVSLPNSNDAGSGSKWVFGTTTSCFKGEKLPFCMVNTNGAVLNETLHTVSRHDAMVALRLERGGVDSHNFNGWADRFVRHVAPLTWNGRKCMLVYDAYRSHISFQVLQKFVEHNIIVYTIPSHSSGKAKPLDVVSYSVFRNAIRTAVRNCTLLLGDKRLVFCDVMKHSYYASFTRDNIQSSFRRCGIWPLDPSGIMSMPRPSSNIEGAPLSSVEEMLRAYHKRRFELRHNV